MSTNYYSKTNDRISECAHLFPATSDHEWFDLRKDSDDGFLFSESVGGGGTVGVVGHWQRR